MLKTQRDGFGRRITRNPQDGAKLERYNRGNKSRMPPWLAMFSKKENRLTEKCETVEPSLGILSTAKIDSIFEIAKVIECFFQKISASLTAGQDWGE